MIFHVVYTAFCFTLMSTAVGAQSQPPSPLSCTEMASTACTDATTVYNAIMANEQATAAYAGMVTTVQNMTGAQGDPMYQTALSMLSTTPKSGLTNYVNNCTTSPPTEPAQLKACKAAEDAYSSLQKAVSTLQSYIPQNATLFSDLSTYISKLAGTNMIILQTYSGTSALGTLIGYLNAFDVAETAAAKISIPSTEKKSPVPSKK